MKILLIPLGVIGLPFMLAFSITGLFLAHFYYAGKGIVELFGELKE